MLGLLSDACTFRALYLQHSCIILPFMVSEHAIEMIESGGERADAEQIPSAVTDSELLDRLRLRCRDCRQHSMTARLSTVIGIVETILGRGYARSQVREILAEEGWQFTPDSFDSALSRVRKRRAGNRPGARYHRVQTHGAPRPRVENLVSTENNAQEAQVAEERGKNVMEETYRVALLGLRTLKGK